MEDILMKSKHVHYRIDVTDYDTSRGVHLGDNIDDHFKPWILNGNDFNDILRVHESGTLPFVCVIWCWCCWIPIHVYWKSGSWVGITVWWHTKMQSRDGECPIVESLRQGKNAYLCSNWTPKSFGANIFSHKRFISIFFNHVFGTIGQSKTSFLFATNYTMLDVVRAKLTLMLHIGGGKEHLLHLFVCWSRDAMFANYDFGIAQSACINIHWLTSFGRVQWQSCNVPLGSKAINLQHQLV